MNNNEQFKIELLAVILCKVENLISNNSKPDLKNSIDISPQVGEIIFYQSIYQSLIRGEMSVNDQIGLFVNFPMTGEEAIAITYKQQGETYTKYFVIDMVKDITALPNLKSVMYLMNFVSFEGYLNARTRVSQSYSKSVPEIISDIQNEYINEQAKKIFPNYPVKAIFSEYTNQLIDLPIVVPNFNPYRAITWLAGRAVSTNPDHHTFLFFENFSGLRFTCIQGIIQDSTQRSNAKKEGYKFVSNDLPNSELMSNEGRLVQNISFNRRLSSTQKISSGYFQNTLFEINPAQKAFFMTPVTNDDIKTIDKNHQSREVYELLTRFTETGNDEDANRVHYIINNYKENDPQYTNPNFRNKWGKMVSSASAFSQIDISITVPGNVKLQAGNLFYLEIPEMHGFTQYNADDLLTGYYIITEAAHVMATGGSHTTTLRLNKDSYSTSVDRDSRY